MKILFEVLERDRYESVDPILPAGAEARKIAHEASIHDTVRILEFDPQTLQIVDTTSCYYDDYQGSYLEDMPAWIEQRPGFDTPAGDERRERREMQAHIPERFDNIVAVASVHVVREIAAGQLVIASATRDHIKRFNTLAGRRDIAVDLDRNVVAHRDLDIPV